MPVYEYRCVSKGHQFEVEQRMSDDPISACEVCGGEVQRVLFAPAIHFKGTGFHNTDYGTRKRARDGERSDGAGTGSADGASSSGGDSSGGGDGAKAKEATPAARARRGVGP